MQRPDPFRQYTERGFSFIQQNDFARSEFATKGTRNGLTHSERVSKVTDAILHSKVTDSSITLIPDQGCRRLF